MAFKTITQKTNSLSQKINGRPAFPQFLKKYLAHDEGEDFMRVLKDATHMINVPKEMRKNSSKSKILAQLTYYMYLKLKYH